MKTKTKPGAGNVARVCTVMLQTDGRTTLYGVFRGRMRGKAFDLATAEHIGSATYTDGRTPDYTELTAKFATPEIPAVYWQAPGWNGGAS